LTMAFEGLAEKLQETFRKLRGKGKLSERDVKEALREVRLALLEADVNFRVVKDFVKRVQERATGQEVMKSLTPGQQVVKIVHEELTELMGGAEARISVSSRPPTVVMLVGLQGSGKTTTAAKLSLSLLRSGRNPLLVAADTQRPAAIDQLQTLGASIDIPVFEQGDRVSPVTIARNALDEARSTARDTVIIDTAGRLHIDEQLMDQLGQIKDAVEPDEILLVVDAMTGQDAVLVAEKFDGLLNIDGVILTKLDGDTRGGAALSVRAVTGKPIKFVGVGEKLDGLEAFHPERMASRILGMGDVMTLIERAQTNIDEEKAREMERKLRKAEFTFEDFLDQLEQVRNMGPLDELLSMIPGFAGTRQLKNLQVDDRELGRIEAIINSMTRDERVNPDIIDGSRRRRIARGSGTRPQDVNRLVKQFKQTRQLIRQFAGGKRLRGLPKLPF